MGEVDLGNLFTARTQDHRQSRSRLTAVFHAILLVVPVALMVATGVIFYIKIF